MLCTDLVILYAVVCTADEMSLYKCHATKILGFFCTEGVSCMKKCAVKLDVFGRPHITVTSQGFKVLYLF